MQGENPLDPKKLKAQGQMYVGFYTDDEIKAALIELSEYIDKYPLTEVFNVVITNENKDSIDFHYEYEFSSKCKHYYFVASATAQKFIPVLIDKYKGRINFRAKKKYSKNYKYVLLYPTAIAPL